jgi:hypothetical protein
VNSQTYNYNCRNGSSLTIAYNIKNIYLSIYIYIYMFGDSSSPMFSCVIVDVVFFSLVLLVGYPLPGIVCCLEGYFKVSSEFHDFALILGACFSISKCMLLGYIGGHILVVLPPYLGEIHM